MATTLNIPRDATLQSVVDTLAAQNSILSVMMAGSLADVIADPRSVRGIVRNGGAAGVFGFSDQLTYDWTDNAAGKTYEAPHNVVCFDDVTLASGETAYGLWLQWHYATPYVMPFDAREAFYVATSALAAGTYYFTVGTTWGAVTSGEMWKFTLTKTLPVGGQLVFDADFYTNGFSGSTVSAYADSSTTEATETVALTSISTASGTSLGTISNGVVSDNVNNLCRACYGYNRWSQSAIRQWLNSAADIGEWWEAQNVFDRPPTQLATYPGFLSGYSSEFLSCIQKVKVTTALNTVTDSADGTSEDTYDYFFLPSLEQQYITPQLSGVEGDAWGYWKLATGSSSTIERQVTGAFPKTYAINSTGSAQTVRLRSAYRVNANNAWYVGNTGTVSNYRANVAARCAPACVIC